MLLGYEHVPGCCLINDQFVTLYRKRVGPGRFVGCALFSYLFADTLEPVEGMQELSQLDQPIDRDWKG